MFKFKIIPIVIILVTLSTLGIWIVQTKADFSTLAATIEEEEIKQAIETYFEARYRAHTTLQLEGIANVIDTTPEANDFRVSELDKLEIELYHTKVYQLRYQYYKFFLDFGDISIDEDSRTATVSVVEGHNVVFESDAPNVSSMRNLKHMIKLREADNVWIIVSDYYEDYVWRMLRETNRSKEDVLISIDKAQSPASNLETEGTDDATCNLTTDETSHPYSRYGAIEYAHQWATANPPYNSPLYDDFTNFGGDCTNFVSQAIHERGNAEMVFGGAHGIGTNGWYYYSVIDRAAAWNLVDRLYNFIVGERDFWYYGPEGCEVTSIMGEVGDLIQYDWDGDGVWDHGVIIVSKGTGGQGYQYWVAGHTPDVDNYPYQNFNYANIRFIHIERIDGYSKCYFPLVMRNEGMSDAVFVTPSPEPYPAPFDSNASQPEPYPPP